MHCDLCGKETNELFRVEIEGSILNVCKDCASLGKVISKITPKSKKTIKKPKQMPLKEKEIIESIVPNYSLLIKNAREKLGLKQEELAKKIAEKDSLIHAIESGKHEPPISVARKLERVLGIHLVIEEEIDYKLRKSEKKKSDEITLGDVIKIRKR